MRLLLAMGVLGGVSWLAYAFVPPECVPVTAETEVFCSRLWTPALLLMTGGFAGLRVWLAVHGLVNASRAMTAVAAGAALMTVANGAEYWVFFEWSFDGPDGWVRGMLLVAFLLGWAALLISGAVAGIVLLSRRNALRFRALGSLAVTVVSLTAFIGLLAVGALALTTSLFALVAARRTSSELATEPA